MKKQFKKILTVREVSRAEKFLAGGYVFSDLLLKFSYLLLAFALGLNIYVFGINKSEPSKETLLACIASIGVSFVILTCGIFLRESLVPSTPTHRRALQHLAQKRDIETKVEVFKIGGVVQKVTRHKIIIRSEDGHKLRIYPNKGNALNFNWLSVGQSVNIRLTNLKLPSYGWIRERLTVSFIGPEFIPIAKAETFEPFSMVVEVKELEY